MPNNDPAPIQSAELAEFDLAKALRKAYNFGQTYWQQADSEYFSQQKKSDETANKFAAFVDESVAAALAAVPAIPAQAPLLGCYLNSQGGVTLCQDGAERGHRRLYAEPVVTPAQPIALSIEVIDHCWKMYQQGQISADHTDKEVFAETLQSLATWLKGKSAAQPIADVSAPTERKLLNAAKAFAKEHIEGDALHDDESTPDDAVKQSDERYNETKRLLCDAYLELQAAPAADVSAPTDERDSLDTVEFSGRVIAAASEAMTIGQGEEWEGLLDHICEWAARAAAPTDQSPYEPITLANLRAGKLSAARVYVGYCELSEELKAANGAIKRYEEQVRAAAPVSGPSDDLHAAIMNLIPSVEPVIFASWTEPERAAFKLGHKYARHDAAELVSAAPVSGQAAQEQAQPTDLIEAISALDMLFPDGCQEPGALVRFEDVRKLVYAATPPAAPTAQPLTDVDIEKIITDAKVMCVHPSADTTRDIARAIERHLTGGAA